MVVTFTSFNDSDFDAYLENKWQSNVFNRERLEVKQKLLALGQLLSPHMHTPDLTPLEFEVSAEHPALWNQHRVKNQYLFFYRNAEARREIDHIITKQRPMAALIEDPSPLRHHLFTSVMIDKDGIELALKVHADAAVDVENLKKKCQEYFHREKLVDLIVNLPEGFTIGLTDELFTPTAECNDEMLSELIQRLPSADGWLEIRYSIPRTDPILSSDSFLEETDAKLTSALPVLAFITWRHDNDFLSIGDSLKQKAVEKRSKGLVKGDRVKVVSGIFAGKTGEVQNVDAKGMLKVSIGQMAVKINSTDVIKG